MKYITFLILLYIAEIYLFLGSQTVILAFHWGILALCIYAFLKQFFLGKRRSAVTWFIGAYCILFPIYASYKSSVVFGQPFLLGIASLRYCWFILFGFVLYQLDYDYKLLLKQINRLNLTIAAISIIAFFFFGINHITVKPFLTSTNLIETTATMDTIKGAKLNVCNSMMIISYIYYLIKFLDAPSVRKNRLPFLLLMFYLCFVSKGRQPQAVVAIVFAVYFIRMKGVSMKRMALALLPIIGVTVLTMIDEQFFLKFTTVFDEANTRDSSTMARINSINKVIPYICDNFMLGFGNLSNHYRTFGFHTFFGAKFYLADIGIFGTLARGGALLLFIYFGLYHSIYRKTNEIEDDESRKFMKYMLLTFGVMLVLLCNDTLYSENSIRLALVFYPLFAVQNPNIFFTPEDDNETL